MNGKRDWNEIIVQPDSYFEKEDKMAHECPKDCQEKLGNLKEKQNGLAKTLYSNDGRGGMVKDVETLKNCSVKYITRKGAIGTTLAVLVLISGLVIYGMGSAKEEHDKRQANSTQIEVIQTELTSIKITVDKVLENQEALLEDHRKKIIDPVKLREMIKAAVKEGNE